MSHLTANSVLPIVSALPENEKQALLRALEKMVEPRPTAKKKKSIYDKLPEEFHPDNIEMLVTKITNGQ